MDSTTSTPDQVTSPTLLFRAGGHLYGCDIGDTQEIIPLRAMTRLPGAPRFVRGLINMRGTIVTVLDLAMRLDASREPTVEGSIVLVRHRSVERERLVGIVVDEVSDVRVLDNVEASAERNGVVKGMAAVDDGAVVVLDLDALIEQVLLT